MPDCTGNIRSKKAGATGLTDADVEYAYRNLGHRRMAIVELRAVAHGETVDGQRHVDFVMDQLYPVPLTDDAGLDEHLRELQRTLDYNFRLEDPEQPRLEGISEPQPVGEVIAQGVQFIRAEDQGDKS